MKRIVTIFVIAGTAIMFAPTAFAGEYSDAINQCKIAISNKVGGDKVLSSLGDVDKKGSKNVELDFAVKVMTDNERTRMKATCLATKKGEVLELAIS